MPLSTDAAARKATPIFSGVLKYFPDALAAVAEVSRRGNDQHNPGQPLHWSKGKSTDHDDCAVRHMLDAQVDPIDTDGGRHRAKAAWRALAALQIEIEAERAGLSYEEYIARLVAADKLAGSNALKRAPDLSKQRTDRITSFEELMRYLKEHPECKI